MPAYNRVVLAGNLTRDPEIRNAGSSQICTFSLAINRKWTKDGEQKEDVTYVDIDTWGKLAKIASEHLTKGRPVLIEGYLKQERWDSPDGKKMSRMKVVAEFIQFLGGAPGATQSQSEGTPGTTDSDALNVPF